MLGNRDHVKVRRTSIEGRTEVGEMRIFGEYKVEAKEVDGAWVGLISRVDGALFRAIKSEDSKPCETMEAAPYATKEMVFLDAERGINGGGLRKV
jgi:hypothetical protein